MPAEAHEQELRDFYHTPYEPVVDTDIASFAMRHLQDVNSRMASSALTAADRELPLLLSASKTTILLPPALRGQLLCLHSLSKTTKKRHVF